MTRVESTANAVELTANAMLDALLPLVEDLSRDLPDDERYRRLLGTLRALFPGDAAALLRLDHDTLVPVAVDGLSRDTMGRRFRVADHPRFAELLARGEPTRFPADSALPDPYDGLVQGVSGQLEVHDCLGGVLAVGGRPWGLLTLDALDPACFDRLDLRAFQTFVSLAAATVSAAVRIDLLARHGEAAQQRADAYRQAAGPARREMIGRSKPLARLADEIRVVANSDLTVLITGETGVGKELVASALHAQSPRADKPMISLNCAALPDTLVESELFGHVRGAFSGASADRRGKFELADGATLFLDEVGELPQGVQAKLLRVLQNGQLQRIGSDREHRVDVRLIAATNRDLAAEVKAGRFRADLYHRLSVYPLRVPPLRERGRDVLLLAGFFLEENRARLGLSGIRLAADAQAALLGYAWPGNVRELEHLIGRSAFKAMSVLRERPRILTLGAEDLGLGDLLTRGLSDASGALFVQPQGASDDVADADVGGDADVDGGPAAAGYDFRDAVTAFERHLISEALARHRNNWAAVARELALDRANLNRLAKRLGLK